MRDLYTNFNIDPRQVGDSKFLSSLIKTETGKIRLLTIDSI